MSAQQTCDFCGQTASDLTIDADGLRVCDSCEKKLRTQPTGAGAIELLPPELQALIGESAGEICHSLNLPFTPPYTTVIEAAQRIAYDEDRYMSAWLFMTQWQDGTTIWQSESRQHEAIVAPAGTVTIRAC